MTGMRSCWAAVMQRRRLPALLLAAVLGAPAAATPAKGPAAHLELTPCRISDQQGLRSVAARCGRLAVAENPDAPAGRRLELAVAVVPAIATRAAPDPLFLLAGGPGQGARAAFAAHLDAFAGVRRERDLVLVDQRGTGDSNRLDCDFPEDSWEAGDLPPAELARLARDCLAQLPGQPAFYTTSVAVGDLDAVRAALGYERINLFGASYGTRVAQHYARRFPEHVRTLTLDAVAHPQLVLGPAIALEAQRALDAIFARCAADPACAQRFPDPGGQFRALLARLRRAPVSLRLPDPVTGAERDLEVGAGHLVIMARMLSYSGFGAALLPLVIDEAQARGNLVPLAAQALLIANQFEGAFALGMHNSVVCSEDAAHYADDFDRAALEQSYLGSTLYDGLVALCAVWPRGPVDPDLHAPLRSDIPVLLLSGEADPVTPPAYATAAAAAFSRHRHLVLAGQGHGQIGATCVQRVLRAFIAAGDVAGLDTRCADEIRPRPFFLSFAGPPP
ncbi:MAG: alpha/beta fold hydrolase [Gammaproteobacteria bacterium]|nr:alpha/beta fold hydrolase [Gammaproteobacteria bacterium]